jgi:hypothetical protein
METDAAKRAYPLNTLKLTALALVVSVIGAVTSPAANDAAMVYYGSSKSDKYHLTSCQWAQKIAPSNLVVFKTKTEAAAKGYVPCKVCKP